MDTFVVAHAFDVHFTFGQAQTAIGAFIFIKLYAEQRDFTKKPYSAPSGHKNRQKIR